MSYALCPMRVFLSPPNREIFFSHRLISPWGNGPGKFLMKKGADKKKILILIF
jgi:hypothetical protein